ncbi:synaptosomal-associated protein 23-like [Dysidea avara]|uniref:synaptosomal-associated protein 23-like n=1 Tax=Dysidea avara TaxID=196820 RepID=UPI0033275707
MNHEAERLENRIDMVTNETLDATRRIRQVAEETNQIGIDTLVTLNEQGEQLDNVEGKVDNIGADLRETDRHLHEIEKCCGCCVCPCYRVRNIQKSKAYKSAYGKKKGQQDDDIVTEQPRRGNRSGGDGGNYVQRVTNDEREDEMDKNLQVVGHVLGNLKGMAQEMGSELDRQNDQIERIDKKAGVQDNHLKQANRRIQRQL